MQPCPTLPRQKEPKDGAGPRGFPDCYYTSRVLDSTFRYVKYIKKLRTLEEEHRKGAENNLKELKDKQYSDFFIRCDRRSLIKNVARRVDLCMESYQMDLKAKRRRLVDLLTAEEEMNIRKFVEQAQAGAEAIWQDKQDRLAYLLAKRKKEHEEKYKDTPLSKCSHILPCITKIRAKEAADIQLYQIREHQCRKMAEKELDNMWYELAMKESEALAARMEIDAIERKRKNEDCNKHSDYQLEQKRQAKERDKQMLKQEALKLKKELEQEALKEKEAELKRQQKRDDTAKDRKDMIKERQDTLEKQAAEHKLIADTWDSLAGMGLADEKAEEERRRQKERELDICNKKMIQLKTEREKMEAADDVLIQAEAKKIQDKMDQQRCKYVCKVKKNTVEVRKALVEQIKENEALREQKKKDYDGREYERQLSAQLQELVKQKQMTDAQAKKLYQKQLQQQIDYNKVLKERAWQEEMDQRKKCEIATAEYQAEMNRMLCRPFFSDEQHPFMKAMHKGLTMQVKCPCSTSPDYCAAPQPTTSASK